MRHLPHQLKFQTACFAMRFQTKFICCLGNKSRCGTHLCILLNYMEQAEDKRRRQYAVKVYAVVSQCVTRENKYCTPCHLDLSGSETRSLAFRHE